MQISSNLILDYRKEVMDYAKELFNAPAGGDVTESALAEALTGLGASAPQRNIGTIREAYTQKFADDLKIQGADRYLAMRIAKDRAEKVLEDVMLEIES